MWCSDPLGSLSFEAKKLEFFSKKLEFLSFVIFFNFWEGNWLKIYHILHFFGALRANIGSFELHGSKFTTGLCVFWVKSKIATGSLNFDPEKALSF